MKNEDQPQGRRRKSMKIRSITAATCMALAISMAGPIYALDSNAETVTRGSRPSSYSHCRFRLEVDYAPGAAFPAPRRRQNRPSSPPMRSPRSSRR